MNFVDGMIDEVVVIHMNRSCSCIGFRYYCTDYLFVNLILNAKRQTLFQGSSGAPCTRFTAVAFSLIPDTPTVPLPCDWDEISRATISFELIYCRAAGDAAIFCGAGVSSHGCEYGSRGQPEPRDPA